ncbi:MAG: PAS domain S-box protein, partial [Gemmatimonadaceae bacterium]|nr:PAS domain S-box protein [Chitinophagaceae bacterium]
QLLTRARETGSACHEGWLLRSDGSRFWASLSITSLHNNPGEISGFLTITKDLTDKRIAEERFGNRIEELRLKNEELKKSEERYHKMISEVQDYAIILLDVHGNILDWNKGAEKLKGYTPEEILGKSFRLFYPLEDKNANLPQLLLDEAARLGSVTHEGFRIKKDGTRFWGSVVITAIHDDEGGIIGYSKVTKDLSDRKATEDKLSIFSQELETKNEQLKQSEERYHKMIAEVQDYAILLLNRNGDIQNWNAGAEVIKGYSASEIIGNNFKVFYTSEDIQNGLPDRLLKEAEITGKAMTEGWRKRKDGTKFWGSIVITALHNDHGNVIGFSKVTRDLTEKKKAEDSLKQNALELEHKNHALQKLNAELLSFAYVVSHDLKEPIRKMQIFAGRQLEPDKSVADILNYSQKIIKSASRMQQLMEALLAYSQLSHQPNAPEPVDLNRVLDDVKDDLELKINQSNTTIKSDLLPSVNGIAFQFHQLFMNLAMNAIKFSKPGESPVIHISSQIISGRDLPEQAINKNKDYHVIRFSDNGMGFDQEHAVKIFDVFQRLHPSAAQAGTGIGLAIVKKVVDNHDGFVMAEGEPGKGATFKIFLPA